MSDSLVTVLGAGAPDLALPIPTAGRRVLGPTAVELRVSDAPADLQATLSAALPAHDVAVQIDTPWRRVKSFVAFDMDSTLLACEVIDELGKLHGVGDAIAAVTARAMAGELDYEGSLRARVAKLEGLSWERVQNRCDNLPLMDGAREVSALLKATGTRLAVLSGGFEVAASRVQGWLDFDHAHANTLEVKDGALTGRVLDPVVTPERKALLFDEIRAGYAVAPATTMAVGDGANDLKMLARAGLGVAFHGKPRVRAAADASVRDGSLLQLLYLLGWHDADRAAL